MGGEGGKVRMRCEEERECGEVGLSRWMCYIALHLCFQARLRRGEMQRE